ncbi:MAG TPA: Na+/H+ antiporter NhaA [Cyclobacteriaceae bacterium]|nr:Na+/H+ antiporter NhaA [Cyclobacteriaceae bacterium]
MMPTKLFNDFFKSERAGGILLIFCAVISLALTNSPVGERYQHLWHIQLGGASIEHWINDGLMAIFFLLIGLELEREIYVGELSRLKQASLPVIAAVGGMVVPAGIFLLLNRGLPSQSGAGIPMATDIAFAIGILSLLGNRVPASLKILLTALAVIDDLGAIVVIAIFYTSSLAFTNLFIALAILIFLFVLNRLKVHSMIPYLLGGVFVWYFMKQSGVHATIAGVLLAFVFPFGDGQTQSPSYKLQHFLHKPVAFGILPLFALANTSLIIGSDWTHGLTQPGSIGILAGLIVGKPLGIYLFSFAAVALGMCTLPQEIKWKHLLGVGFLGGIGFTMSIFITLLAYNQPDLITASKIAVLLASLVSGTIGYLWLRKVLDR